jgi:hypothetical protein
MSDKRAELYFALCQLCCDYHSGQWSRGYRLMSRISRFGVRITNADDIRDTELYLQLEAKYANKL